MPQLSHDLQGLSIAIGARKIEGGDRAGMGAANGLCTIIARVPGPQTSYRAEYFALDVVSLLCEPGRKIKLDNHVGSTWCLNEKRREDYNYLYSVYIPFPKSHW